MKKRFFISHFDGDRKIAELISETINRISLTQIEPWYSSDNSPKGGLKPGEKWFSQIITKIQESKAIIAILTPNSIGRPWIYFECGIAESISECEVVPVCIGIDRNRIPTPLSHYQTYQLSDFKSLTNFFAKLFTSFEVKFDEEMSKPILENVISEIGGISFSEEVADPKLLNVIEDFKSYFDKRFVEALERPTISIVDSVFNEDLKIMQKTNVNKKEEFSYSVEFNVRLHSYTSQHFLEIENDTLFSDITLELYYLLSNYIDAYTYLKKWIIVNKNTGKSLVIKEVQDLIPANLIFRPEHTYDVIELNEAYNPTNKK